MAWVKKIVFGEVGSPVDNSTCRAHNGTTQNRDLILSTRWLFLDMNAFFASVEQQVNPELRGKPVIVAPVLTDNTVAIAASYEAKAFGIRTGTTVREAKERCSHLIIVEGEHGRYREYHHKIVAVIRDLFATVKVLSVDEMACRLSPLNRE